jgi:hypothetical protein
MKTWTLQILKLILFPFYINNPIIKFLSLYNKGQYKI